MCRLDVSRGFDGYRIVSCTVEPGSLSLSHSLSLSGNVED